MKQLNEKSEILGHDSSLTRDFVQPAMTMLRGY